MKIANSFCKTVTALLLAGIAGCGAPKRIEKIRPYVGADR